MPHNVLIIDSIGHVDDATFYKKWDDQSLTNNVVTTNSGRFGQAAIRIEGFAGGIKRNSAIATAPYQWTIGFGVYITGHTSDTSTIINFNYIDPFTSGQFLQGRVQILGGGRIRVIDNSSNEFTSTYALHTHVWYHMEIRTNLTAVGTVEIYINSELVLTATGDFEQDVLLSGCNQIHINTPPGGNGLSLCDIYILEGSNSGIGDARVLLLKPNGDGAFTEWATSTGTVHYTLVDEVPRSGADYVISTSSGNRELFTAEDTVGTVEQVHGVQEVLWASALDGTNPAKHYVNQVEGPDITNLNLYDLSLWLLEPVGTATWSQASLDAVQFGMKDM